MHKYYDTFIAFGGMAIQNVEYVEMENGMKKTEKEKLSKI